MKMPSLWSGDRFHTTCKRSGKIAHRASPDRARCQMRWELRPLRHDEAALDGRGAGDCSRSRGNDAPSQQNAAPAGDESSAKARSAKIDIKPMQPPTAQPTPPQDTPEQHATVPPPGDNPAPRAEWRRRRDARLDSNGDGVVSGE